MKNRNKFNLILIGSFIIYIAGFFILFMLIKDKDFSDLEKRKLASFPKLNKEEILSRRFGNNFETYLADQFPFRNNFVMMKSVSETMLQKKENNGVYIGKNNSFIEKFEAPDEALMDNIAKYINNFSSKYNTYMMIAPTALTANKSNLPSFIDGGMEEDIIRDFVSLIDTSNFNIDLINTMKAHGEEYIYYKTDHHWTTLGAYYAYVEFCKVYGLNPKGIDEFNVSTVTNDFYGTLFSKGNFMFAKPDTIKLFYPKQEIDVKVDYVYSDKIADTMYEMKYVDEKDKYGIFLDNNHPLVKITTNVNSGKRIGIIKDSYSHSLIPFLANHFDEIHIIDLRLFKDSVGEYMDDNNIEDILFVYNVRNIISDRNIVRLRH